MKKTASWTITTRTCLFLAILSLTAAASIGSYMALTQIWSKQLASFKQKYAAEQSHHLLYTLRERMKNGADRSESIKILEDASRHFAVPIRYVGEDRQTMILDLVDPAWLSRPGLFSVEAPLVLDGKIDGYLTSFYDTAEGAYSPAIRQLEEQLERRGRTVLILFLSAAFAVSLLASWRWSRNISASSDAAETIVTSNQLSPIPVRGTKEIRVLMTTINHLIDRFERHESWRNQLMQDLTHELRTPLTAVLSQLDAIIDGIYPLTADQIQRILVDIERLYRLVEDMEKLSEAEGAQFELNKQEVIWSFAQGGYIRTLAAACRGSKLPVSQMMRANLRYGLPFLLLQAAIMFAASAASTLLIVMFGAIGSGAALLFLIVFRILFVYLEFTIVTDRVPFDAAFRRAFRTLKQHGPASVGMGVAILAVSGLASLAANLLTKPIPLMLILIVYDAVMTVLLLALMLTYREARRYEG